MYIAHVRVTLRPSILDPEGKAIRNALRDLGMPSVAEVRTGSFVEMRVEAPSAEAAEAIVHQACEKLLANPVTEDFEILALVPEEGVPAGS